LIRGLGHGFVSSPNEIHAVFRSWLPPLALIALLVLPSCSAPRVDPALARVVNPDKPPKASVGLWPRRLPPGIPSYIVKQGEPPVDEGTFKSCRVFKAGAVKDGVALFVASRRQFPVKERRAPFTLTVADAGEDHVLELRARDHRVTLAVLRRAKSDHPRGLIIYLTSIMLISEEEKAFIRQLQKRGWNVAAITPSIDLFAKDRWEQEWDLSQLDQYASLMAYEIDNHLAETAYATEAVLAYLRRKSPSWLHGPHVVIGASAGALAAPILIKRLGGVDAAVYVGGGANVPEIALESSLRIYRPRIVVNEKDPPAQRQASREIARSRLKELALQRSRTDPLNVAPLLPPVPTLMLSGELDLIVPAHTGDLLYNALGRPERWRYPAGHIVLFLGLPLQADRVVNWIEGVVARNPNLARN
jgi:fermentation-respiration switch protein FrsA (DUF1100 family)|tara:strand:+ start:6734 stop:7984 length:1251 start_codon:yes stop_codon:yes gene_type:complete